MGSYRHLTQDDRDQIAGILAAGLPQSRIADQKITRLDELLPWRYAASAA